MAVQFPSLSVLQDLFVKPLRLECLEPNAENCQIARWQIGDSTFDFFDAHGLSGNVRRHAATPNGFARSILSRSRGSCIASQRSLRRWTFSQKSGLLPNTRASMSAVAAVTLLRLLQSSFTCLR